MSNVRKQGQLFLMKLLGIPEDLLDYFFIDLADPVEDEFYDAGVSISKHIKASLIKSVKSEV